MRKGTLLTPGERIKHALDRVERRGIILEIIGKTRVRDARNPGGTHETMRPGPAHYGYPFATAEDRAYSTLCGRTLAMDLSGPVEGPVTCKRCLPFVEAVETRLASVGTL